MAQVLSKLHFLKAAARLGFAKESKELWKALDKDDSGGPADDADADGGPDGAMGPLWRGGFRSPITRVYGEYSFS